MTLTGPAGALPEHEQQTILAMAAEEGVQATFLAAIRLAENGGPGREFGVLSESAPTYESQARICAVSIRSNLFRFVGAHNGAWPTDSHGKYTRAFVDFMASRWAPQAVANDPGGLNQNWPINVYTAYAGSGVAP